MMKGFERFCCWLNISNSTTLRPSLVPGLPYKINVTCLKIPLLGDNEMLMVGVCQHHTTICTLNPTAWNGSLWVDGALVCDVETPIWQPSSNILLVTGVDGPVWRIPVRQVHCHGHEGVRHLRVRDVAIICCLVPPNDRKWAIVGAFIVCQLEIETIRYTVWCHN